MHFQTATEDRPTSYRMESKYKKERSGSSVAQGSIMYAIMQAGLAQYIWKTLACFWGGGERHLAQTW